MIELNIVTPTRKLISATCSTISIPGYKGELGILPRHTPLLTRIKPGTIRLKVQNQAEFELVYVSGGMLEVQPDMITVLADTAIRAHDLDEAKAMEAKKRAEEALSNRQAEMDYAYAEIELAQAIAQLQTIQRLRKVTH